MSVIYDLCVQKYEQGGQAAVLDFISRNFSEIVWNYCKPCESKSPIEDNTCLVCGSNPA
jgi:hypothetical protein